MHGLDDSRLALNIKRSLLLLPRELLLLVEELASKVVALAHLARLGRRLTWLLVHLLGGEEVLPVLLEADGALSHGLCGLVAL